MKNKKKIIVSAIVLAVLAINLFYGLSRIGRYSAVDEPYWVYGRISKFWTAVSEHKWHSTNINDKPGVTTAIIAGPGLLTIDPMKYKSLRQEPKSLETVRAIEKINFSFRLPIYLAGLVFLLLFYFFLKKLFGTAIALFATIFIGLSPVILGISLIINPDSLLWGFLPLTVLAYLIHQREPVEKTKLRKFDLHNEPPHKILGEIIKQKKYLILAGIFLGLSILTKYVANILYVYLLGLMLLEYIYNSKDNKHVYSYLKKSLIEYLALVAVSVAVFFLLFPATWTHHEMILDGTFLSPAFKSTWPIFVGFLGLIFADLIFLKSFVTGKILDFLARYKNVFKKIIGGIFLLGIIFVFYNVYAGMKPFDFEAAAASPKGGEGFELLRFVSEISTNLYELVFSLTPLVFLFFLFALFASSFKKEDIHSKESDVVLYLSCFILLYYVASEVNHVVATTRYQISAFPLASIIAAIGLAQLLPHFKWKNIEHHLKTYLAAFFMLVASAVSLALISPYFFNYASPYLPQKYLVNFKDMGDGSFEAARYLNSLPDAKDLVVWSDKGAVCETFVGTCKVGFHKNDTKGFNFNYFIVSAGRENRSLKMSSAFYGPADFKKLYSDEEVGSWHIYMGGRLNDFVKVVPAADIMPSDS